jgi:hypothetical protein
LRAKDLLFTLHDIFGIRSFDSKTASQLIKIYVRKLPVIYLVDNPKGLSTKWLSNDLNRLRLMSFLNRKREKRSVQGISSKCYRGFQYRYQISVSGKRYLAKMQREGFMLVSRAEYSPETQIYLQADQINASDIEKAAFRHSMRVKNGLAPSVSDAIFVLEPWKRVQYLAQEDRIYRRQGSFRERYGIYKQIRDKEFLIQKLREKLARTEARNRRLMKQLQFCLISRSQNAS